MRYFLITIVIALLSLGHSCEYPPAGSAWSVRLANDSDDTVIMYVNLTSPDRTRDRIYFSRTFPTSLLDWCYEEVPPKSFTSLDIKPYKSVKWSEADTLEIYVFSPDTLRKYTLKEIERDNNFLKVIKDKPKNIVRIAYP